MSSEANFVFVGYEAESMEYSITLNKKSGLKSKNFLFLADFDEPWVLSHTLSSRSGHVKP
jgi:hypothetical protein